MRGLWKEEVERKQKEERESKQKEEVERLREQQQKEKEEKERIGKIMSRYIRKRTTWAYGKKLCW